MIILWLLLLVLHWPGLMGQDVEEFLRQSAQLERGHLYLQAKEVVELGLRQHSDEPLLQLHLGKLLLRMGHSAEAEQVLDQALRLRPDDPVFLEAAAEARLRQGKRSEAIRLFLKSLRHRPEAAETHHRLAFTFLLEAKDTEALEHSQKAVAADPTQARYRRFYALLLETALRREEAYQQLRAAYQLSPGDPHLWLQLSEMKRLLGDWSGALEYLDMALDIDPENPLYYHQLARVQKQLGQHQLSQLNSEKARHLRKGFQEYLKALGLSSSGQLDKVIALLQAVVRSYPELTSAGLLLADLYRRQGKNDRALESYLQVLKKDPGQRTAREQGAWIQLKSGSPDLSQELLGASQPKSVNQFLTEGYLRLVEEDWSGALEQFRAAEKQIPLDTDLLQLISTCWSAWGREGEALNYLAKASAIRPGDHRIQDRIWQVKETAALQMMQQQQWSEAVTAFQELIDRRGLRSADLFRLAYSHQQVGQLAQAITRYRAGLAANPNSEWARTNLASCLYRSGRYREAAE